MYIKELLKDIVKPILHYKSNEAFYFWKTKYRDKLLAFKNIQEGEDCFIIGNGPSLKLMDLNKLNAYHTFGLNKAYLLNDFFDLKFSYHVCVDDVVLDQISGVIEEGVMKCPTFIDHLALKNPVKDLPHINRLYTSAKWSFYEDISLPICTGYTVTYVAMQIAFYMGFRRVFLIGVDHNWKDAKDSNTVNKLEGTDMNHFHAEYFKGLDWHSPDKEGNEASYSLARHFFHQNGREIFDATVNGKLNIFPKISFEDALKLANKK